MKIWVLLFFTYFYIFAICSLYTLYNMRSTQSTHDHYHERSKIRGIHRYKIIPYYRIKHQLSSFCLRNIQVKEKYYAKMTKILNFFIGYHNNVDISNYNTKDMYAKIVNAYNLSQKVSIQRNIPVREQTH